VLIRQGKLPRNADLATYTVANLKSVNWTGDHDPALAAHWVTLNGNNAGDNDRWDAAGNLNNISLMESVANTTKQAGGHQYNHKFWVGPNFTSIYADGGRRGAMEIDGQPMKRSL
jgi:hypothetical protein